MKLVLFPTYVIRCDKVWDKEWQGMIRCDKELGAWELILNLPNGNGFVSNLQSW